MSQFLGTTSTYRQGERTLDREYYTSESLLAQEIEQLFRSGWMCVGRADRVAVAGQYLLHDRFGDAFIVLRDRAGVLRAFWNVCRHRGTRLCEGVDGQGRVSETIQCPYHAWTWATDGRLLGAPHMQDVEGFDKRDFPLRAIPVVEWEGFILVNHDGRAEPFERSHAPLIGRFARFGLPRLVRVGRKDYAVAANWKLILQNYNECLHCPTIHPELSAQLPYTSGANDLHEGPFLGGYMEIAAPNESVTVTGRRCGHYLGDLPDEDKGRAYYYSFFPNMMLSMHPDYATWYSVWPVDTGHSIVTCEWMMEPEKATDERYAPADAIDMWHIVNQQDWHICEQSQIGVSSRGYIPGPYSARESIPAAWDREYLSRLGRHT